MDRKFQSDEQWYASPLLDLKEVKANLLSCRNAGEQTIDRTEIAAEIDAETDDPREKEKSILMENVILEASATEEDAMAAVEEVSNLDMFLEGPSDLSTRRLIDIKGDEKMLADSKLATHRSVKQRDQFLKSLRQRKSTYITSLKYDKFLMDCAENTNLYRPQAAIDSKCDDDIVIIVDALFPYNRMLHSSEFRSSRLLRPLAKFLLRGDTLLYDLRQKLCCQSDTVVPLENGRELEPPNLEESTAVKYPSSFIFIHDTFYVDNTAENVQDISFPIRSFMAKKEIFDPVKAETMEDTRIIDLKLRLGQPYVFQHSGTCEHLLVFHDLRLLHETDPKELSKYPYMLYEKGSERRCDVCRRSHVEFVVEKHELLPNTYTYFCRSCFREFNFVHDIKTHSFKAWPYTELHNQGAREWPVEQQEHT